MKIKILKKDFDKAMSVPWGANTCLIAQCAIRTIGLDNMFDITDASEEADRAMNVFDHNKIRDGEENIQALKKLRASLPITVTLP